MTADRLAEIRARAETATLEARRFRLREDDHFYGPLKDMTCGCSACAVLRPLIELARTDIPWLLGEIERISAALNDLPLSPSGR